MNHTSMHAMTTHMMEHTMLMLQERPPAQVRMIDLPCQTYEADLWFAERPEDVETAKTKCLECPERASCLAGALERGEPWGVWGGQLLIQGAIVARKRPRGRPRKTDIAA